MATLLRDNGGSIMFHVLIWVSGPARDVLTRLRADHVSSCALDGTVHQCTPLRGDGAALRMTNCRDREKATRKVARVP